MKYMRSMHYMQSMHKLMLVGLLVSCGFSFAAAADMKPISPQLREWLESEARHLPRSITHWRVSGETSKAEQCRGLEKQITKILRDNFLTNTEGAESYSFEQSLLGHALMVGRIDEFKELIALGANCKFDKTHILTEILLYGRDRKVEYLDCVLESDRTLYDTFKTDDSAFKYDFLQYIFSRYMCGNVDHLNKEMNESEFNDIVDVLIKHKVQVDPVVSDLSDLRFSYRYPLVSRIFYPVECCAGNLINPFFSRHQMPEIQCRLSKLQRHAVVALVKAVQIGALFPEESVVVKDKMWAELLAQTRQKLDEINQNQCNAVLALSALRSKEKNRTHMNPMLVQKMMTMLGRSQKFVESLPKKSMPVEKKSGRNCCSSVNVRERKK